MYAEAETVVEGALDDSVQVFSQDSLDRFVEATLRSCRIMGLTCEIFVLWHDHEPGIDCECIQYKPDHHPYATTEGTDA